MEENKTGILLESGTNELEVMEFTIAGEVFGINVAKVTEIMIPSDVKPMQHAHPCVEGVFKPRGNVITVIDLPKYLGLEIPEDDRSLFIITNFNKMDVAFRVQRVVGIARISWTAIQKPDKIIYGGSDGVATGLAEFEDRLITILDFEKIVAEISPETSIKESEIDELGERQISNEPIVIAEDSVLLAKMIVECLHKAGYRNINQFDNGQEAWDYLSSLREDPDLRNKVSLVITDIEMPKMDGHRLTKLIKDDTKLRNIPVVIFSSLINEETYIKGKSLGADEQLSKPEIGHLVEVIDHLLRIRNEA
ncbi:MAG: chemotaxis protein CheV [Erysipelotrichales bacterium]|nr:chemotaxis protein CheV [Erysipelotrichales bacterium]